MNDLYLLLYLFKMFMSYVFLCSVLFISVWTISFFIQSVVVSLGSAIWINSIDNQLSKHDCYTPFDTHMNICTRFVKYSFQYPFIYKRATTKDKKFYIIMTVNSLYTYTIVVQVFLMIIGVIPIDSV